MTDKKVLVITEDERDEMKIHSLASLDNLQNALTQLKADLYSIDKTVCENSIAITASVCLAVEEAIKHATKELKINGRI